MKSSTGQYFVGLDHVRALAVFMVFAWHFIHIHSGHLADPPLFPLSILTEGHTGVALFMTLSGYLFAKLLNGKNINYPSFIWNRILRLAPLLILVILLVALKFYLQGGDTVAYFKFIREGLIKPVLPNGGWSITVELHFYLILPLLLFISRKSRYLPLVFIAGMIGFRLYLYHVNGTVQFYSYYTIIGRIDQFVFGILAYQYRDYIRGRHYLALFTLLLFAIFYTYVDTLGGFYSHYPFRSRSAVWAVVGTVEGFSYALLIAWYDNSFRHSSGRLSRFIALIGTYSYSIYLLHIFYVFDLPKFVDAKMFDLSNIYVALIVSPFFMLLMMPVAWASYHYVELPFLRFRTKYIKDEKT
ncbi:acyltransferase family protein [Candidatus Marimicrobium litorale]|uniref:Acyltransferase n=1 Tax=Candidatus Marimicrobium litorale TaxID=2518991 RepID=A0ABT3TAF2_9GAMM|nr:acyltransferase [Candidatus Marimicrobium litorale]MCX2978796.1 acyltransferase [Candidatus Marimicrobium litorale]